jgi:hypothetical protein
MMSFDELAKMLESAAARATPALEVALAKIGGHTAVMAAEYIGHELAEWKPLAPSTVEQKTRLGYVGNISATDPLLRTGANRDSIKVEVEGLEMAVGSDRKEFLWMELGTSRVPPRPSIALAALRSIPYAEEVLGETAVKLLGGKP